MRVMISRYAPAPTGFLHLGHIVNAIYVWGFTRAREGRVLLRIEDHDRQRSRPAFEAAIVEDLEWLGFRADGPMVRQSERGDIYSHALDTLRARGLVYACACSRAEILASTVARADVARPGLRTNDDELWYPGTCRDCGLIEGPGLGLRVRLEPTVERFVDLRHGPQEQQPSEQCGDLLVRDRDGNWTYQFAATVDDYVQGVTHVIRGDDLLPSTGRQIQLARLLGRIEPPAFLHHPLIMKSPTGLREPFASGSLRPGAPKPSAKAAQKLSKSDGDTGVRELRAKGSSPERVIGRAAALAGLTDRETDVSAVDVSNLFTG
jgi:glutamyl/glutaminyl-tRNA synthetase